METIYSDGKTLEIEQKLNCTVFLPQNCYFCGKEIKKFGKESGSLCFHSLDEDHDNWDPTNKVPAHIRCHSSFHTKGDKNPSKNPDIVKKVWPTRRARHGSTGYKDPEAHAKAVSEGMRKAGAIKRRDTRRKNDPNNESYKRSWTTRRELYPPMGYRKPRENTIK